MTGYISGFLVYTLAMIGVIFIAFIIAKKSLSFTSNKNKSNFLKVENSLNLEPRKNLYVVKAGREKFLIASSGEGCQFISKLGEPKSSEFPDNDSNHAGINKKTFPDTDIPMIDSLNIGAGKYSTRIF